MSISTWPVRQLGRALGHARWWLAHHTQPVGGGPDEAGAEADGRQPASVRVEPDEG